MMIRKIVLVVALLLAIVQCASAQTITLSSTTWYQNGVKVTQISVGHQADVKVVLSCSGLSGYTAQVTVEVKEDVPFWFDKLLSKKTVTIISDGEHTIDVPFLVPSSDANNRGVFIKVYADIYSGGVFVKHITIYDNTDPNIRFAEGTEVKLTTLSPPSTPSQPSQPSQPTQPPVYQPTPSYPSQPSQPPTVAYGKLYKCEWYQNAQQVHEIVVGRGAGVRITVYTQSISMVEIHVREDVPNWFDKDLATSTFYAKDGYNTYFVSFTVPPSDANARGVFVTVYGYTTDGKKVTIYDNTDPNIRFAEGTEVKLTTLSPPSTPSQPSQPSQPTQPPVYQPTPSYPSQPSQPPTYTKPSAPSNQLEMMMFYMMIVVVGTMVVLAIAIAMKK